MGVSTVSWHLLTRWAIARKRTIPSTSGIILQSHRCRSGLIEPFSMLYDHGLRQLRAQHSVMIQASFEKDTTTTKF